MLADERLVHLDEFALTYRRPMCLFWEAPRGPVGSLQHDGQ